MLNNSEKLKCQRARRFIPFGREKSYAQQSPVLSNLGRADLRSKSNEQFRFYPIDDDAGSQFPAFPVTRSGNEIKVKLLDDATGVVTLATTLETSGRNTSIVKSSQHVIVTQRLFVAVRDFLVTARRWTVRS